ncbi:HEAT repeat domain-containing protein [Brevundimonas sp. Root1423]|uniref:HEAT repeat domain-containing protein n=1 Tax=Brevundimonas sp. Root1423 TaxID=1736462 RepID=UPI0006FC55D1|nr:HEAT repeat domain-containing protein [Brevundimonas sp. Root1423]KQY91319.1 hypothetical protein ASD25_19410 [Brevundimonas sp. Root1423]
MTSLMLIWSVSLALTAAAVLWMIGLIIARIIRERTERRRERDRQLIHRAFLDILAGSGDAVGHLSGVRRRARVMAESLLDVVALVRGAERERLISALQAFGIDEVFSRRLFRGSVAGRMAAAEALSIFPGPGGKQSLRKALSGAREAELRVGLMGSLIDLGAPPSLEEVLADLSGRRASDSMLYLPLIARLVAGDPLTALQAFGDPNLTGDARIILAESLGASGDYRALAPLCIAARAPDVELRIACIRGLTALGHPAAEPVILDAMSDTAWFVRVAASEAAGRIGLRQAIPELAALLEDEVWWVRFRAGEALAALGDVGRERLAQLAATGGDLSRRTAAIVLAERGLAEVA